MSNITMLGRCPERVLKKAIRLLRKANQLSLSSKKLSGMKNFYSIKVAKNYRILFSDVENVFLCSHNQYDKKIKNIKRQGA